MAVLLVRAFQKSSALYDAMESRCYNGSINVLHETVKGTKKELVFIVLFDLMLMAIAVLLFVFKDTIGMLL